MRPRLRWITRLLGIGSAPAPDAKQRSAQELRRRLDETRARLKRDIPAPD